MSVGLIFGLVVLLLGYAFLYKMVKSWGGNSPPMSDILFKGCP